MFAVKLLRYSKPQEPLKLLLSKQAKSSNGSKCFCSSPQSPRPTLKQDPNKISAKGWFLLAIPAATFGLGCWQVQRKSWKENLIRELNEKTKSEPVPLPENLEELNSMEYRPVKVRGKFLHDKELYMGPRSFIHPYGAESKSSLMTPPRDDNVGYHVVTPLKLSGREEIILVNRGWIPKKYMNPLTRQSGQITDEVELTGTVRLNENRPQFSPEHRGNVYLYRDLRKMCSTTGADPIFIDASYESSVPGGPVGGQTRISLRNEHLSYIITWFSLSGATAFMWYRQILRRKPL
ncbi:SURF1-like protein [Hermetia illucens]|uniref:SURF1-like protein n=1 Tax=Hermetia illucens TaxID=343691 RepID=UPI0018CBFFBB|nr:SURF1-like protein [Hermetia illucens]XP_037906480.1 SURF1-like protein [Hermetia illucens]